jgi:hypothetical protein
MTAGRKKNTAAPEAATIDMDSGAVVEAGRALAQQSAEMVALQQQLGLEDLSPTTLVRETRLWIDHSARAMYEVGIRLVALRAQCPQGEWHPLLEQQIGMSSRTAQRFMSAALKCIGQQGRREKLLGLDRSKVMELVSLDDDALDELDKTGRLSQMALELDDIDRMSTTELRQRLRERDQTIAAKDKVLSKKDERINRLEERLERPYAPSPESEAASAEEQALLDGIRAATMEAHAGLLKLAAAARDLSTSAVSDSLRSAAHTDVQWLAQRLAELATESGIEINLDEIAQPAWVQAGKSKRRA